MTLSKIWRFEMTKEADKAFGKLDKPVKQRIITFFEKRVLLSGNPRLFGKPLSGNLSSYCQRKNTLPANIRHRIDKPADAFGISRVKTKNT